MSFDFGLHDEQYGKPSFIETIYHAFESKALLDGIREMRERVEAIVLQFDGTQDNRAELADTLLHQLLSKKMKLNS